MSAPAPIPWKHIYIVLCLFSPLWVGAVIVFGTIGAGYSLLRGEAYAARQPLVIRDEANGSVDRLGRFASQTELKAAQETILEMARHPEVVRAALRQLGPATGDDPADWLTTERIDAVAESNVNIVAPSGADFGNSEVIYLEVKGENPARANHFCRAMFDSLTEQLRHVRRVRADSIIAELVHSRDLAKQELEEALARINEIEVKFGTDLGELRNLNDTIGGNATSRNTLETTTNELQSAELELQKLESLHQLLVAGVKDPQHLLISGGDLLESQPSLQRLKAGLIDAQLESSKLSGIYTDEHPKRRAAQVGEADIRQRMQSEAAAVVRSLEETTLRLARQRVAKLAERQEKLRQRLDLLAQARADYSKFDADVRNRTRQLSETEQSLSEARASRSAALSTNLIAELGPPQVAENPVGPGGTTLTMGSAMAGLMFGLGAVFLIAPGPTDVRGRRRWSDYLQGGGRRASDPLPTQAPAQAVPAAGSPAPAQRAPAQDRRQSDG